ncbi:MAG: hypothetical protein EBT05_11785, partial [Betaproteobacteria bacterium]|nr:hypothetical protein [Betaproteobacteria bacterium]
GSTLTSDISVGAPVLVQGHQYRVSVTGAAMANANGPLSLVLANGQSLQDLALNPVSTTVLSSQSYWLDNNAPRITAIERGTSVDSSGRTNLNSVDFIVSFSEAMDPNTLTASRFVAQLDGSTLTSDISLSEPLALGDNRFRISASGSAVASANGVLSLGLATGSAPTDWAGNALQTSLPSGAASYTLDHSAPTAVLASVTDDVAPFTGSLTSGARTNDTQVELAGTNELGALVQVYNGSTWLGKATVTGTSWTYVASLANGSSYNFNATETDIAGNTSTATAGFVLIGDTTAPNAPLSVAEQGTSVLSDARMSAAEALASLTVRVTLPTSGSLAMASDSLSLLLNGQALSTPVGTVLSSSDISHGYVDFSINTALLGSDGVKALSARLQDGAGNQSGLSAPLSWTLDTQASAAPSVIELGSSKLADGTINILEASTSTLVRVGLPTSGALPVAGDKLQLLMGSTALSSVTLTDSQIAAGYVDVAIASGQWGSDGGKALSATLTDKAGNVSPASVNLSATLDTVAPTTTVASAVLGTDTGVSSTDLVTNTAAQTISGTLSANLLSGEVVNVSLDGGSTWASASASVGSTSWSLARTLTSSGTLKVKVTDAAGNDGSVTSKDYVLDTVATNAPLLSNLAGLVLDGYLNTTEANAGLNMRVNLPSSGALPSVGDRVELLLGGSAFATAKVLSLQAQDIGVGYVSFAVTKAELGSDGLKSLTAIITDVAGNPSAASSPVLFTLDSTAPSNSANTVVLSTDSGTSGDFVTNAAAQNLSGTLAANLAAGETVRVSLDEGKTWQTATTTTGSANWALNQQNLGAGSSIWVQVIDNAGNTGALTTQAYTLDITAPTPTLATAILPNFSSIYARSNEVGKLYLVNTSLNISSLASITAAADNLWNSASVISANADTALSLSGLADGSYRLYASDVAGNLSLVSSNSMTVDSTAPPSITSMALSADTGALATDFVTKTAAQTIGGTLSQAALTGQKVKVSLDGGTTWVEASTTVDSTYWSLANQTLSGSGSIKAKVLAVNGLESFEFSKTYTVDTTAPTTTVATVAFKDDNGSLGNDLVTNVGAQTISGTLSANLLSGEAVYVSTDNGSSWQTASTSVGSNSWSLANQTLSGSNSLKVKVSDTAGNDAAVTTRLYTIDTSAPVAPASVALYMDSSANDIVRAHVPDSLSNSLYWYKSDIETRVGTTTGPNAAITDAVVYHSTGTVAGDYIGSNVSYAANTTYQISVWAKLISGSMPTSGQLINFNNLAITYVPISSLTTDWKLYTVDFTSGSSSGKGSLYLMSGKNTAVDVALWGAQMVVKSSVGDNLTKVAPSALNITPPEANGSLWYSWNAGQTYSNTYTAPTVDGNYTVWVRQQDLAGNNSAPTALSFTLDTSAPSTTIATALMSADTAANGSSNTDFKTKAAAQTFSGTLSA